MDIDFPLILLIAVFVTGLIALADKLYLSGQRQLAIEGLKASGADDETVEGATKEPWLIETSKGFFPVLALVLVLRSFLVEPFQIPSGSMEPTLVNGDFILVNKFAYGLRLPVFGNKVIEIDDPARGDVMVFIPPHDPRYYIKRVIGLPGDHIRYSNKRLYINGEEISREYVKTIPVEDQPLMEDEFGRQAKRYPIEISDETIADMTHKMQHMGGQPSVRDGEWVVPKKMYFMMGDNRENSADSRFWGFVPDENVVGKAFAVWMHWENWTSIPSFNRNKIIH